MFFRNSRYRKLPDELVIDSKGRRLPSKILRLLPEATGIFLHTIEDSDRLDHLAHKYYNQSRKWWRICDANPDSISPQALLGKTPFITQRIPISFADSEAQPPWARLIRTIAAQVGVKDVWLTDDEAYIVINFNRININISTLSTMIEMAGFTLGQPQMIDRTGKQIVIPPDTVG